MLLIYLKTICKEDVHIFDILNTFLDTNLTSKTNKDHLAHKQNNYQIDRLIIKSTNISFQDFDAISFF